MNSAVTDLTFTDIVQIAGSASPLLGQLAGLNPSPLFINRCAPKPSFQLRFSANSVKEFGFLSTVDFDIEFVAQSILYEGMQQWSVSWIVQQSVNKDFSFNGRTIHIDSVNGVVSTGESILTGGFGGGRSFQCGSTAYPLTGQLLFGDPKSSSGNLPFLTLSCSENGVPFLETFQFELRVLFGSHTNLRAFQPGEAIVTQILSPGVFVGGRGVGLVDGHPVIVDPTPVFRENLQDLLTNLSFATLSHALSDPEARRAIQSVALQNAQRNLDRLQDSVKKSTNVS